jgi:hypothetical protein
MQENILFEPDRFESWGRFIYGNARGGMINRAVFLYWSHALLERRQGLLPGRGAKAQCCADDVRS